MDRKNTVLPLKIARQAKNLTQKEVADLVGVKNPTSIYNWEQGLKPPKKHHAKYAKALGMSEAQLLRTINNEVTVSVNFT